MAKDEKWVHRTGKTNGWGYEQRGDQFRIAPCYAEEFMRVQAERQGLDELIRAVSDFVAKRGAVVSRSQQELWERVLADLGIDSAEYAATYSHGVVTRTKREKAKP